MGQFSDITIVIPAYNAAHLLPKVIPAAQTAGRGCRVLVVDPGSSDDTADVAEGLGAEVLRLGHRGGPAIARNRGVEKVTTPIVLFIDSDCVAHPDVVERVQAAFDADDELVSIIGSYDDTPPERNFASLYMNLRHHAVHQQASTEGALFWGGCGAAKVTAYREVGGFDEEQFPVPSVEDLELGMRLQPLGTTRLDPKMHVTHLKRWTVPGVIRTDIVNRAAPWSRLIWKAGQLPNDLNLSWAHRFGAALAPAVLLGLPLGAVAAASSAWPLAALAWGPAALSAVLQRKMIRCFGKGAGPAFAVGGWLFHQLHLIYSTATFVIVGVRVRFESESSSSSVTEGS